jgi:LysR family glycine cleavage system transcriptional activator
MGMLATVMNCLALEAAIDGQGVALARSVMAHDDLASGRLVRLFPSVRLGSPLSYYVVYRADCVGMPRTQRFRKWLLQQAS